MVSTFLRQIADGETIEIWGDGSVVRDYLDVRDLAEICVIAGTVSPAHSQPCTAP